jgi:hypothetical protein
MTSPSPGFGTAPFGISSFAVGRNIKVGYGKPRARTLAVTLRTS